MNPFYVQEIAEALKGVNIPVLVKNPIHAEIGLWAGAIERFQKAGTKRIAAVHRGFFSTAKSIYRNEPEWQHSFDLRALMPEIKIICDPSHIAGDRSLIKEVSQVAMDLGMEGLMIETHRDPDCALSDAKQQITPAKLGEIIRELKIHTEVPCNPMRNSPPCARHSMSWTMPLWMYSKRGLPRSRTSPPSKSARD